MSGKRDNIWFIAIVKGLGGDKVKGGGADIEIKLCLLPEVLAQIKK